MPNIYGMPHGVSASASGRPTKIFFPGQKSAAVLPVIMLTGPPPMIGISVMTWAIAHLLKRYTSSRFALFRYGLGMTAAERAIGLFFGSWRSHDRWRVNGSYGYRSGRGSF